MTTEALVKTVLRYPLNFIIFAYDNPLDAVKLVLEYSPLHQELISRDGAAETILQYFENTNIDMDRTYDTPFDVTYQDISYSDEVFFEYLIASGEINGFDKPSISSRLNSIVEKKFKERSMDTTTYSSYSIRPLIAIQRNTQSLTSTSTSYVYTYFGQALAVQSFPELSAKEILSIESDCQSNYPNARIIRHATRKYNGHSFANKSLYIKMGFRTFNGTCSKLLPIHYDEYAILSA